MDDFDQYDPEAVRDAITNLETKVASMGRLLGDVRTKILDIYVDMAKLEFRVKALERERG